MRNRQRWAWGLSLVAVVVVMLAAPAVASAQRMVFLVRHAERADGGAGAETMTGAPADPLLSAAGEARAARLAAMLADSGIRAIYATEFRRTLDTARPLAEKLKLQVRQNPSMMSESLASRLRSEHPGDVVLVVGHSNTLPVVLKALGGPDITIPDREYDNLFIFVPATKSFSRVRF
jgi:broad specificity phosphatase PhoE